MMLGRVKHLIILLLVSIGMIGLATTAFAEKRVALVIGNADYVHASPLRNPSNDAEAMAARLEKLSFDVIKGVNLDQTAMRKAINAFADKLAVADVGLLFYAGHGLQVEGSNYLLPIDAELRNEIDLQFQGVSVNFLLRIMESKKRTSIVLLDACRNNPLAERLARSIGNSRGRSISSGLARIESGVGTYIGFSTSPDSVALDGDGDNSPFTTALLKHISTPDEDIESIMRGVRADVIGTTNGAQVPWGNSSLVGSFVFKAGEPKQVALQDKVTDPAPRSGTSGGAKSGVDKELELAFWNSIKDQNDARMLISYLSKYPTGEFADLARLKLDAIISGKTPPPSVTTPPVVEAPKPDPEAVTRSSRDDSVNAETLYWRSISDSDNPGYFEAYLQEFPNGTFSSLARLKLALLRNAEKRATPPAEKGGDTQPDKVASVDERSIEIRPIEKEEVKLDPTREDIREIQEQLNRLGCSAGRPDGVWGGNSRSALRKYADHAGKQFASLEPTLSLVDELKAERDRICPLECGSGFIEENGRCKAIVVNTPPARTKAVTPRRRVVQEAPPVIVVRPRVRVQRVNPAFRDHGAEDP